MTTYTLMGTTAAGDKIAVEARLQNRSGEAVTVDHESITGYRELAISGALWRKGRSLDGIAGPNSCGQMADELRRIVKPAGTLTLADLKRLADIWEHWHLNGMRAGCAHMTLPESTSWEARRGIVCPETGYKYGSAWLVKPLPAGIWAEIQAILAKGGRSV